MRLTISQHRLLVAALRRHTRFNLTDLKKPLTEAWTGLGSKTTYRSVLEAGLMTYATTPNPRYSTWWKLTPSGAVIIAFWHGQGYDFKKIEAGILPSLEITP